MFFYSLDSVDLHTCRNGGYSSFPVKFTHFVFDQSRARYEKYEKNKTYVFYSKYICSFIETLVDVQILGWTSRKNSLELIELPSINKVSLV